MTEPKRYFINPCCFGDDVARWLLRELHNRGLEADTEPGQEDFGWYFNFQVAGMPHTFVIGHRPGDQSDEGTGIGWIERRRSFIGSLLGARNRGINLAAPQTLHSILSSFPQIQDIKWHFRKHIDKGQEYPEYPGAPAP